MLDISFSNIFDENAWQEKPVSQAFYQKFKPIYKQFASMLRGKFPIISICNEDEDKEIQEIGQNIKQNFKNLIVLGTGGSTLAGQSYLKQNRYFNLRNKGEANIIILII